MRSLLITKLILFFIVSGYAQTEKTGYKIYDCRNNKEIKIEEIVSNLQPGSTLIFGEQHDDSIAHLLQLEIVKLLYSQFGENVTVTMEMFERDVQPILSEYLEGVISEKNFRKEARAWGNYDDYKPIVEFAKEKKLPVVAANAPARYVNLVTRKGLPALNGLSKHVRKNFIAPLPVDTLTGIYHDKFMEVMGGHSVPGMHLYHSQNFWDATMAYSINQAYKKNKKGVVYQLNGRFHSDYYSGLAYRLIHDYKQKVVTISSFYKDDISFVQWSDYVSLGDYIIITLKNNNDIQSSQK